MLADLREGRLSPRDVPPYLVRYYRAHLERVQASLEDRRPLVETSAWAEAWEALEGGFGGYLGDVQAVWNQAKAESRCVVAQNAPASRLGLEIRCALIEASLHSLAGNIPPTLLAALVEKGIWTPAQGLAYARQISAPEQRSEAFRELTPHLPPEQGPEVLAEALAAARKIKWESDHALAALAPHLPPEQQPQVLAEALAAAREIELEPTLTIAHFYVKYSS